MHDYRIMTLRIHSEWSLHHTMTVLYSADSWRFALQDGMCPQSVPQKLLSKSTMNAKDPKNSNFKRL